MSEHDLASMLQALPKEGSDWQQDLDVVVVPLSLDQFWDAFWSDDAPYYLPARPRDPEDKLLGYTSWGEPSAGFETAFGKPVIEERIFDQNLKIDSKFASQVHSVQHLSLVERSDTKITIKATNVNDGAPYVEDFQTWLKWEFLTPDPRSNQVAIR